ncbi:SDR family oxidoreductase [Chloroflexota bacterium]
MILVVGATGQLGTTVVNKLVTSNHQVRAFVRRSSNYQHFPDNVDLAFGDLRDAESLAAACDGVEVVIATANSAVPSQRQYSFEKEEGQGYLDLIEVCKRKRIRQFVYMSLPISPIDNQIPTYRYKRLTEQRLQESGVPYTIVRASLMMDVWLALLGSTIPLRKAEAATLERPFWFSRLFMRLVGGMIEERGLAVVNGDGKARHAFLAKEDAAAFLVNSIDHSEAKNAIIEVGGPEVLSWDDVVGIYSKLLDQPVRPIYSPPGIFRFLLKILMPFSPGAANVMGLNWWVAVTDSAYDVRDVSNRFGVSLTSVEQFLSDKMHLQAI